MEASVGGMLCIPMRSIILVMYGPKSRVNVLASICGSRNEYGAYSVEGSLSYDGVGEHPEWASGSAFSLPMELGA